MFFFLLVYFLSGILVESPRATDLDAKQQGSPQLGPWNWGAMDAQARPFAPMAASGVSDKWQTSKKNVLRILTLMLVVINTSTNHPSKGLYPNSFDEFTAALACKEDLYALFATWLAFEYDIGHGDERQRCPRRSHAVQ